MGFHKRYFDINLIEDYARTHEYAEFKRYLLGPDAYVFTDNKSSDIWKRFEEGNEENRMKIYKNLRNEN